MDKGFQKSPLYVATITSLKIWLGLYGIYLLIIETLFFNWFPLTIFGTVVVSFLLLKFRISPAKSVNVDGFFGQQIRPEDSTLSNGKAHADGPLTIVGHRGTGLDAPENSLSAVRLCKERGCESIEFDVSITKDFVPIIFHDDNLMRMTGIDREVKEVTWEELQRMDISVLHSKGEQFRNERVPSLKQMIDLCLSLGVKFIIDLKDDDPKVLAAVLEEFKKPGMYAMGIVSSFYAKVIFDVRRQDPNIIGCMAWRPGYFRYRRWSPNWENLEQFNKSFWRDSVAFICDCLNDWALNNLYWWFLGLSCVLVNKDAMSKEETYRWTKKGLRLYVAVVNSPLEKSNFLENNQIGYFTDTLTDKEIEFLKHSRTQKLL